MSATIKPLSNKPYKGDDAGDKRLIERTQSYKKNKKKNPRQLATYHAQKKVIRNVVHDKMHSGQPLVGPGGFCARRSDVRCIHTDYFSIRFYNLNWTLMGLGSKE